MFQSIINFKNTKLSWSILFAISTCLLISSLFFQHVLGIEPCVLCIFQRIGVMGLFFASLIPLVFGLNKISKFIAYSLWILSASTVFYNATFQWYETYQSRINPFFMSQCGQGMESYFPFILESDILTKLFVAQGICTEIEWSFLSFEMHHWMSLFGFCFLVSGLFYAVISLYQAIKGEKDA